MAKRFGRRALPLLCGLAIGLGAAAARADIMFGGATWTQSIQGIDLTVTNSGATCTDTSPARVPGAGFITCPTAGLQATGTSTATSYDVSLTLPLFQFQAFTTGGAIDFATRAALQGAQNIAGNALSATATQGIAGMVTVGRAMHTMVSMWTQPLGGTLVILPLSVGKAGVFTGSFTVSSVYHYLTVDFYAWTPGSRVFAGLTSGGLALPDVVAMGSFNLNYFSVGTVTLVAPSKISIDGPAAQRRTASFTTLSFSFVPEPSTLLLLGAGGVVLPWLRRRG
jgi:hypothetical protein